METLPSLWAPARGPSAPTTVGWAERAAELVATLADVEYGRTPSDAVPVAVRERARESGALGGAADRIRLEATVSCPLGDLVFDVLVHLPAGASAAPVFVGLSFCDVDGTLVGPQAYRWPYREVTAAGFAVVTADYQDIEPDDPAPPTSGVRALFPPPDGPSWGAVAAWAWGLSRLLDVVEGLPGLDPHRAIAIGHSRLGKAALWAGACDNRFAGVVSNDSGCAGAALHRHRGGEDVRAITTAFPHWFPPSFARYAGREDELPVDQHQLLAAIAPRSLYVASAAEDHWADPSGERLAVAAATPAFRIGDVDPVHHVRAGGHDLLPEDWLRFIAWAGSVPALPH